MNNPFVKPEPQKVPLPRMATVDSVSEAGVIVTLDGDTEPRTKAYKRVASYTPASGDRVLLLPISGTYIIMGKVI